MISFESDWLILPQNTLAGRKNNMIASLVKDETDSEGYLQSANVRHRLINSPRKGVFYTGSCHDDIDQSDQQFERELLLSSVQKVVENKDAVFPIGIEINTRKCKKCLTCFRVCPHGAIILKDGIKPYIVPQACFSCGLCLSSCPAMAIESSDYFDASYINFDSNAEITVFACERSGALAAQGMDNDLRINIQTVPCVCRISTNIILKALEKDSNKIILAGCHQDNCCSMKGSKKAIDRVTFMNQLPGIDSSRVVFYPVAANESIKFNAFIAHECLSNPDKLNG